MKHRMPAAHDMHPNVTPLIDIVMCLIIFYMLVAKIGVATGARQDISLPQSTQGRQLEDMGNTVTLNVMNRGLETIVTALDPSANGGLGGEVTLPILEAGGRRPLTDFLKKMKGNNKDFKVIIRADENLNYQYIEPVLQVCTIEVKVKTTNYATRKVTAERAG